MSSEIEIVKNLNVPSGTNKRMDCPFCYHRNTFSVRNENGKLLWNCFHSSCNIKGGEQTEYSMEDIENYLNPKQKEMERFIIPKHFINIATAPNCMAMLQRYDLDRLWYGGQLAFYYDVKQNRLVFPIEKNNIAVNATGRSLKGEKPKWYIYGKETYPYIVGNSDTAVLVEDCISACVLFSAGLTGIAILGTSLKDSYIPVFRKYKKVYVCLDEDATSKAFDIADQLRYYVDTEVKILDDDIKYLGNSKIQGMFGGY